MSHHSPILPPLNAEEKFAKALEPLEVESLQATLDHLKNKLDDKERKDLGATGKFPEGRLTPTDEGEFTYRVGSIAGKVLLDFGKPVTWIGFDPEQAEALWRSLRDHTRQAIEQQKIDAS